MADLLSSLLLLPFGLADAAANTSSAIALIPDGAPDATDVDGYAMPKAGAVVGIMMTGKPTQSGDSVNLQVFKNGNAVTAATLSDAYNAGSEAGASVIFSKDAVTGTASLVFAAGDLIQLRYTTTTGGTYGVRDVIAQVIVQMGLSE